MVPLLFPFFLTHYQFAMTTTTPNPATKGRANGAAAKARTRVTVPASVNTRVLALDAGNYDLKFYSGNGHPKAIRSVRYQLPQGRDAVSYSDASPLIELPDGRRYHFGAQSYKYRRQQQTVIENKVELARLHLYACLEPLAGEVADYGLNLLVSTPIPVATVRPLRSRC
jgi:hypothetical protein